VNARLRVAMEKTVTVKQMLAIQQIEIEKARCNSGGEGSEEIEDYKDATEAALEAKELTELAMKSIQVKSKEGFMEGMRLLRVAALQQDDPSAAIILFRLYNEMEEHGKAAYFLVRRAAMEDCEPMCNAMVGSMHDDGMQLFPPWTGLALYYYQRAAKSGRQCMMDLSNVWRKGYSKGSEEIVKKTGQKVHPDPERQMAWLKLSIARGSGVAMFIKAQLHMQGDGGFKQSKKEAVEAWSRALAAAPQLQQQQQEMEKMLSMMPNDGEAVPPRGTGAPSPTAAAPTAPSAAANQQTYAKPDMSEFGSAPATEGSFLTSTAGQVLIVGVLAIGVVVAVPPVRRALMGLFGK
jgi:TPR repeat protein